MSKRKKQIRAAFRDDVFKRDEYRCTICGLKANKEDPEATLDAHHIVPRVDMPFGGYVKENGITLCKAKCHLMAEEFLQGTAFHEGFAPETLYEKIGSDHEAAKRASSKLA